MNMISSGLEFNSFLEPGTWNPTKGGSGAGVVLF